MLARSLERFDFDTVMVPNNYLLLQDRQYAAEYNALADLCRQRDVPILTMKAIARSFWKDAKRTHGTWYRPLDDQTAIDHCVHWVMAQPDIFLISCGDLDALPKYLDAAGRCKAPPANEEMAKTAATFDMEPVFI